MYMYIHTCSLTEIKVCKTLSIKPGEHNDSFPDVDIAQQQVNSVTMTTFHLETVIVFV